MPTYFKPLPTKDGKPYAISRKTKNGKLIRDQLPFEGIYTDHEMNQIVTPVGGYWVHVPAKNVGFVFGLRQIIGNPKLSRG